MICHADLHRLSVLLLVLILPPGSAVGQSHVSGVVVNANTSEPLSSAQVFVEGGTRGTVADDQGRFQLKGLAPGRYTVAAAMMGYEPERRSVIVEDSAPKGDGTPSLRFELRPDPIEMRGVTVEGSREEWAERLEEFREAFFGTVPTAEKCSFVNPEVLAFEETEDALVTHAEKPLRVRNDALGYELTYHLSEYVKHPERRMRFGLVEFDTLEAPSPEQRQAWREARRETYRGSFTHFIDALRSNALEREGFVVSIPDKKTVSDATEIFRSAGAPGWGILVVPEADDLLRIAYTRKRESRAYARLYRRGAPPRDQQISWIQFYRAPRVIVDAQTGAVLKAKSGYFLKKGYWGWYETAATALPRSYRPPDAS